MFNIIYNISVYMHNYVSKYRIKYNVIQKGKIRIKLITL